MSKKNPFKYYKTSPEIIKLAVMYYIRYPLSFATGWRYTSWARHWYLSWNNSLLVEQVWNFVCQGNEKESAPTTLKLALAHWWSVCEDQWETHYLWRAIDHEGTVLDCYVSKKRNRKIACKILTKLIKKHGKPNEIITDKLASYKAALKQINSQ